MVPDNIDYNEIMKQLDMPNPIDNDTPEEFKETSAIDQQFQTSIVNSKQSGLKELPKMIENSTDLTGKST